MGQDESDGGMVHEAVGTVLPSRADAYVQDC